jgi:hypothetical protein
MAARHRLNASQLATLRWIADGSPPGVMEGYAHRISAAALRSRDLVRISGRGPSWRALITPSGQAYLEGLSISGGQVDAGEPAGEPATTPPDAAPRAGDRPTGGNLARSSAPAAPARAPEIAVPTTLRGAHPFVTATREAATRLRANAPAAGDWTGIIAEPSTQENPTVKLERTTVRYATTGLAATTNKRVTIQADIFAHNSTAIDMSATVGTNAAIHQTWFDENSIALAGSSDWNPVEPRQYIPTMSATEDYYGPSKAAQPFLTQSELDEIAVILATPEAESELPENIVAGNIDRLTWAARPCQPLGKKPPHVIVATPFGFG